MTTRAKLKEVENEADRQICEDIGMRCGRDAFERNGGNYRMWFAKPEPGDTEDDVKFCPPDMLTDDDIAYLTHRLHNIEVAALAQISKLTGTDPAAVVDHFKAELRFTTKGEKR